MVTISSTIQVDIALANLEAWLESMRGPGGYSGPVVHWWQQSLIYTGAALDWRYEGIIAGYLQLWEHSGNELWLQKARRAGDDLVAGQSADGHYMASAFEINPATAGTPHEAACDSALLQLASVLRAAGRDGWETYVACAERNLRNFYVDQLWDAGTQSFRDSPQIACFVPNKAAAVCEALFQLSSLTDDTTWAVLYALPTLQRIVEHQIRSSDRLDGAIAQNSFGRQIVQKYFPIYIARCIPALVLGYQWSNDEQLIESALRAMRFIAGWAYDGGALPTVIYGNQQRNLFPCWIAPLGDVLRAADLLRPYGFNVDMSGTQQRLLAGQDSSGGIQTAAGFSAQAGARLAPKPDLRDVLHVVGWADKAFRYLASQAGPDLPSGRSSVFRCECFFRGKSVVLCETPATLEVSGRSGLWYRWHKGQAWPEVAAQEFWLR